MDVVVKILEDLGVTKDCYVVESDSVHINISPIWGVILHLELIEDRIGFYYSIRTSSWVFNGERSDLHDVISILFAVILKGNEIGLSSTLVDVDTILDIEGEIYSRYIIPQNSIKTLEEIENLLPSLVVLESFFADFFYRMFGKNLENQPIVEYSRATIHLGKVFQAKLLNLNFDSSIIDTRKRNFPIWEYYRNYNNLLTIIKSKYILSFLRSYTELIEVMKSVDGINGKMYLNTIFNHFVLTKNQCLIDETFKGLEDKEVCKIFLENKIICCGKEYIVVLDSDCGIEAYRSEKEKLRTRHELEYSLLFRPNKIRWVDNIEGGRFEQLVYDLLDKNPMIKWIRTVSHTNEADGGRDLIAEWIVEDFENNRIIKGKPIYKVNKVIIQCKAYKEGVGKDKVKDIHDMLEHYECEGYFLIVSSYLKRGLTEYLEKMRIRKHYWIDWWTKNEIERELMKYPDLIDKYSDIVFSEE